MDHPNHSHPLHLNPPGAPYKCNGCKELGFGPSYRCEICNYILHEECANVDRLAFHRFFPKSHFEFFEKAPGYRTRYCDACGKDVLGFVYHCSQTGFDLHPCCLKLKDSVCDKDGCVTLKLSQKVPRKCLKCKSRNVVNKVKGWSYVSCNEDNNSCYHVSCVKELILENWKRGYFSTQEQNNYSVIHHEMIEYESRQLALTRSSRRLGTIKKYTKIAVVIFKLIVSAIFGNPISAIATLVEALVQDY
ncbi:uncharacterized protein LOC107485466 [Arachis duranensis]|uniref:Uncharacterized protein LOC107485466 n=1 Tax=Arachis duranensis TaxID=130453 RepID=A0A6P4D3F0_ARADU|nr:uncharacterized protein LOC107485466 [Arachis duranensis]